VLDASQTQAELLQQALGAIERLLSRPA